MIPKKGHSVHQRPSQDDTNTTNNSQNLQGKGVDSGRDSQSKPKPTPLTQQAPKRADNQRHEQRITQETALTNIREAIKTLQHTQLATPLPEDAVKQILQNLQKAEDFIAHPPQLHQLHQGIQELLNLTKAEQAKTAPPKSWAQVAQAARPPRSQPNQPTECHTISVKVTSPEERTQIQTLPYKSLVEKINQPGVIAVKRMASGDIKVFTASKSTADHMRTDTTWTTKIAGTAKVTQEQHQVLVHGVSIKAWENLTKEDIQQMQHQNQVLHPGLRISQAHWLKSRKAREGKKASSLIISVPTQGMAKAITLKGFVQDCAILLAEPHSTQHRATQCYNCASFGHITTHCNAPTKCGTCAGPHASRDCNPKNKAKCANCNQGHASWSTACKVKRAARARAAAIQASSTLNGSSQDQTQDPIAPPRQGVTQNKKRAISTQGERSPQQEKRPAGRPRMFASAVREPGQSQLILSSSQRDAPATVECRASTPKTPERPKPREITMRDDDDEEEQESESDS